MAVRAAGGLAQRLAALEGVGGSSGGEGMAGYGLGLAGGLNMAGRMSLPELAGQLAVTQAEMVQAEQQAARRLAVVDVRAREAEAAAAKNRPTKPTMPPPPHTAHHGTPTQTAAAHCMLDRDRFGCRQGFS